jgi:death-on-curing protein
MIRYLTVEEVLELHRLALAQSGGLGGVLDLGGLDSALAQPKMTFGGQELFPTLAGKAAALGFSLVCNHPFVDGNKRVGHAAMETSGSQWLGAGGRGGRAGAGDAAVGRRRVATGGVYHLGAIASAPARHSAARCR